MSRNQRWSTVFVVGALGALLWWLARPSRVDVAAYRSPLQRALARPESQAPAEPTPVASIEEPAAAARKVLPVESLPVATASTETSASSATVLHVRFVNLAAAPVAGVTLRALADGGHATSDAKGDAELALVPDFFGVRGAGTVTLEARCAGFATAQRRVPWKAGESGWLDEWELFAEGSVAGRVLDESGNGVADVRVARLLATLRDQDWEARRGEPLEDLAEPGAQTTTEPDGSFLFDSVPAGATRLVAVAEDGRSARSGSIEIPAGDTLRDVELRLERGSPRPFVAGRVVDPDDEGVPRARLELRTARMGTTRYADDEGRFRIDLDEGDACTVTAFDPGQRLREAELAGVEPPRSDLVLLLTRGPELELLVRDHEGKPVETFGVFVKATESGRDLAAFPEVERAGGMLRVAVPAQAFSIEVHGNGWLPASGGPFAAERAPEHIELRLEPASGLVGRVEADGRAVGGARVTLHRALERKRTYNDFALRWEPSAANESRTRDDGTFLVSVEERGAYFARVEAEGYAPAEAGPLALDPKAATEQLFALGPGGAIAVQVRSLEKRGTEGALVALSHGDGEAFTQRADVDGRVRFERLTPGRWQVVLAKQTIDPRSGVTRDSSEAQGEVPWNCEVFAGETTRIDLWLEDAGQKKCRLGGRLTIDGAPAEGWLASLQRERTASAPPAPFAEAGLFRLSADEPGAYRLFLTTDAADPSAMLVILDPLELSEGESFWSLDLAMGALEGTAPPVHEGSEDSEVPLFHLWERGDLQCLAPIVPDAEGRFRCARVPAGEGRIVRFAPDPGGGEPDVETLLDLVIDAGKSKKVEF